MSARERADQARTEVFAHAATILAANVDPAILEIGLEFGAQTVQEERRVLQTYTRVDPPSGPIPSSWAVHHPTVTIAYPLHNTHSHTHTHTC